MYSIGLDISKSSVNVYVPLGKLDLEIANTDKAFKSLYSKLKKLYKKEIEKVVFVFESTGSYSALLYRFCAQKGIMAYMPNPKQARNFAKAIAQRNKSDKIDARVLSEAIVVAKENEIKVPTIDPLVEEIKEFMVYYRLKVKQRTQLSNHLESLSTKEGSKTLCRTIKAEIKALKKSEDKIIEQVYAIIEKSKNLKEKYNAITSIDGIGKIGGIVMLHLFIKYPHANQRQIVSLAGLDPVMRESGTSIKGQTRISKAGDRLYRGTLFMAAMASTKHNEKMKAFYERLKANGKHTTQAQIAVIRKLIVVAHSLYKSGEVYDKNRYKISTGVQLKA
jgi:transposase